MLKPETVALLAGGPSLVLGTVDAHGAPFAGRAWGITVEEVGDVPRLRVLLDADDATTLEHARSGGAIAITAADVRTLISVQVKGRVTAVEEGRDEDLAKHSQYVEVFFGEIVETDGTERSLLDRFAPVAVVPCTVEVDEVYDQTPGPSAGAPITRASG